MLKDKLASLRLTEGGFVAEYLRQIQAIQSELTSMNAAASEPEIVERIVNTLPPSYDSVYTYMIGLANLPSLADIIARLLQAEARIQYRQGQTGIVKEEALTVAFRNNLVGRTPDGSRRNLGLGGSRRIIGPCNWCGREGHLMRHCTDLAQEMVKRAKDRRAARSSSSRATYHANLLGDENDPNLPDNDVAIDLFDATLNLLDMDKVDGWIIDSGASQCYR